jgi:acetyl esterase/lipase
MKRNPRMAPEKGRDDVARGVEAIGVAVTPQMIGATTGLFKPLQKGAASGVEVLRDLRYGSHERHRLDVFLPAGAGEMPKNVLMFMHGGGFIGGDKSSPDSPFYDNVGFWAAANGFVGVTLTYRLAPQNTWPAGSEDVGSATKWVRENIAAYGGDSDRIVVMGQSAGAVHVAGFIAREHGSGVERPDSWRPAAAILVSGLYDVATMEPNALFQAYFGSGLESHADAAFLDALAGTRVPLMVVVAEWDPPDFLRQAMVLLEAYVKGHGCLPRFVQAQADNHLSTVLQLNSSHDRLGGSLIGFIHERGSKDSGERVLPPARRS